MNRITAYTLNRICSTLNLLVKPVLLQFQLLHCRVQPGLFFCTTVTVSIASAPFCLVVLTLSRLLATSWKRVSGLRRLGIFEDGTPPMTFFQILSRSRTTSVVDIDALDLERGRARERERDRNISVQLSHNTNFTTPLCGCGYSLKGDHLIPVEKHLRLFVTNLHHCVALK